MLNISMQEIVNTNEFVVLTCHFNPIGYEKPRENFHRFRERLQYQVHVVEASFDGNFHCALEDTDIRILADIDRHIIWQKERLINILIESLPDTVKKVAWVDADLLFMNDNWVDDAIAALDEFPIVQLFSECELLEQNSTQVSRGYCFNHPEHYLPFHGHPGFAWAVNLDALPSRKLPEMCICGGADCVIAEGFAKTPVKLWEDMHGPYIEARREYVKLCPPGLGYINGLIKHMHHGSIKNRFYIQREIDLVNMGYDPKRHITVCEETGLLTWSEKLLIL